MEDSQKRDAETEAERAERETREREAEHKRALEEAAEAGREQALLLKRKLQAGAPIEEWDRRATAPSFGPPIPDGIVAANLLFSAAAIAAEPGGEAQPTEPGAGAGDAVDAAPGEGTSPEAPVGANGTGTATHSGPEAAHLHALPGSGISRVGTPSRGSPAGLGLAPGSGVEQGHVVATRPVSARGSGGSGAVPLRMMPPSPSHSLSKGAGAFSVEKLGSFGSASGRLLRPQVSLPGSVHGDGEAAPQLDAELSERAGQHPQVRDAEEMVAESGTPKHGHGLFERLDAGGQASPRKAA